MPSSGKIASVDRIVWLNLPGRYEDGGPYVSIAPKILTAKLQSTQIFPVRALQLGG